jgi:hypothetical protein
MCADSKRPWELIKEWRQTERQRYRQAQILKGKQIYKVIPITFYCNRFERSSFVLMMVILNDNNSNFRCWSSFHVGVIVLLSNRGYIFAFMIYPIFFSVRWSVACSPRFVASFLILWRDRSIHPTRNEFRLGWTDLSNLCCRAAEGLLSSVFRCSRQLVIIIVHINFSITSNYSIIFETFFSDRFDRCCWLIVKHSELEISTPIIFHSNFLSNDHFTNNLDREWSAGISISFLSTSAR